MQTREYKKVCITSKGELSILNGHPWIYNGEIVKSDDINNGELVDVLSPKEKYLGTGFYNNNSKITVRLLSRNANDTFDYDFFKRRVKYAWGYRKTVMPDDLNCVRVIYGEADGFPGLTVDKFNNVLVCQILSLGIDIRKDMILKALYEVLTEDNQDIIGIYEREDAPIRELEGLEQFKGWYDLGLSIPVKTTTEIEENGIKYLVDFENGQKTGFFLDQKYNRLAVKKLAKGHTVLDCCTHTGSFAMNAYLGGATKVMATDISEKAINDAQYNFKLNNMEIDTEVSDVFDTLKRLADSKSKEYDLIIVDPPAFTKSRKTVGSAMKGYEELNYLAMKSLPRGGFLVTASCSHFATEELFKKSIMDAALHAGVSLKQVDISGASPDHPVLWGVPETEYLHFIILQVA
jgi:23S rRNA (cytosine1962-C5)-methyltransferase